SIPRPDLPACEKVPDLLRRGSGECRDVIMRSPGASIDKVKHSRNELLQLAQILLRLPTLLVDLTVEPALLGIEFLGGRKGLHRLHAGFSNRPAVTFGNPAHSRSGACNPANVDDPTFLSLA